MSTDQILLFGILIALFGMLVWGRVRYDLVAFVALMVTVLAGLIEPSEAFHGFGHPAVVIIALVLIVSRGLMNSGAVEYIARFVTRPDRTLSTHIGIMAVVGAALSAIINNVAALALLMSLDMDAARKAKRAVSLTLMPLSFGTILGGMITLIGTPPNIVIAQYRQDVLGAPFSMFDFAPVGIAVSIAGIAYVTFLGWRLIPARADTISLEGDAGLYIAEARVKEDSKSIGMTISELHPLAEENDVTILGLARQGKRLPGFSQSREIREGDFLILEGDPKQIEALMGAAELDTVGTEEHESLMGKSLSLVEAIVPEDAHVVGRNVIGLRLVQRHGVTLLGVSRQGRRFRERVGRLTIKAGDLLLLIGSDENVAAASRWLGVLPLENRRLEVMQRTKALLAIGIFAAAIGLSVMGITSLAIALGLCVVAYLGLGIIGGRDFYALIEWKVIVLLACLIPVAGALEETGGSQMIANLIVTQTDNLPAWGVLTVLMIITMTLSDFLNNVATALIAAPIGVSVANSIGASPDPFLMGVAVAASCAFLTPIGHKNNTIIMGPGNYKFGDYWRMGLILEVLVIAVAVPMIVWVWPF
ncbi:MAG: SLC13 family permease [Hoeflea sp.]|uniref:SLC13 family permease n=1 Tax=Hoeflea sp. TaxID=1940281 RepID=UPI001DBE6D5F|nr:SLC13 family permease [Hoeflea sp.]MBU4529826.1 SLC13 family permease [Alphaproteobacteria bacterium]MBU4547153.1 SLC13 family permease [Alphaproteobacteria bacterium]MBU4548766.1 SLC13 family permease [Alphaproteobacteria bacterium]MBV1722318.1 SLC13 family permease [Hoeflea sp.]MBV1762525.1 SLC13 family permease [Hoeflea sp.]